MNIEDLLDDIAESELIHDDETEEYMSMLAIANMYDEDREQCKLLQDAHNSKFNESQKINII